MTHPPNIDLKTLRHFISRMAAHRVLVIGDIILDEYIIGSAERLSREAAIPVLELREKRYIPGGAANPASNIVAMRSSVIQAAVVGDDAPAQTLNQALQERAIKTSLVFTCDDRPTTVKTRILAQMGLRFPQQLARIDTLSRENILPKTEMQLAESIRHTIPEIDAILCSDYQGGLLTPSLVQSILQMTRDTSTLLTADAQGSLEKYTEFHLVKCNADDAEVYLGRDLHTDEDFADAALTLYTQLKLRGAMVITRGSDGATLALEHGETVHCPSPTVRDVYDTVGAGDTSIAIMTLARLAGATFPQAVMLANYASGIVIQHVGNYSPSPQDLREALK